MGTDWRFMDKFRKKIIKYFSLCVLGMSFVQGILYGIIEIVGVPVDELIEKAANPVLETVNASTIAISLAMDTVVLLCFAFLFWLLMKKAVNEESERQMHERNMQYSSICHDLKTPMTSVQGFAAALREGRIKEEEQQEIFEIIYDKSCYMNELVETLFNYSKLNTDSYQLVFEKTDICTLVRNLVATNYDEFEARDIDLEINIPDREILCSVDEKEFKRSISNLLINSCKHNQHGAKVMVAVKAQKSKVFITVADNGKPISMEEAENIVKPFISGNEARTSKSGSGLGLTIASIIINRHKGRLYVENNIAGYSKGFVVELPKA